MTSKLQYSCIYFPVFLVLWIGLFLDSKPVAELIEYSQWLTNGVVFVCFFWVYKKVSRKIKTLMIYGTGLAFLGEMFFSVLLGMYEYRLENVPIYVPLGHSLIYAAVFYIHKEKIVQTNKALITSILYCAMIIYSSLWLVLDQDILGFLCMLLVVLFLKKKTANKLFFLIMFFMIVYLELIGTYYACWVWPSTWFSKIPFITSSNPPSGISVFYFGFDLGCLWIYKTLNAQKWQRMKSLRKIRATKGVTA
ncbi:hypothetical protein CXF72_00660 [Psychromonas sp. MB-3u-54]|uniref:hypothetical protein n=1 Tax=Psychromonas sp. MB-3u-54 TaxID=2058319 RepID=UPI000C33C3F0|nr:hypothetical protein [Psychromonas sp. MB-3u-54]PKH04428.1 hypothetical protein CXF72_00660 [Psychromonas sp. MB-3u-54]